MVFYKYHGAGNDFLIADGRDENIDLTAQQIASVCDRHTGVGADGVMVLERDPELDFRMRYYNSDGSGGMMCGNGIRCVAKHAVDTGLVDKDEFTIMTGRGVLKAKVRKDPDDEYTSFVQIDMGAPILDARSVPVDFDGRFIDQPFEADGVKFHANAVSMGNPHFITFDDIGEENVRRLGPVLEKHPFFPKKTNVEFAQVKDGKIHITVYERGAAWTLACGTGACATTVAAALNGLVPFDTPVDVRLPGGWLKITADSKLGYVLMEGPAELVYTGDIDYLR